MNNTPDWERELITKLAGSALFEQRRARQWKIFFRLAWLLVTLIIVFSLFINRDKSGKDGSLMDGKHTALISLDGVINSENDTADRLARGLEAAYKDSGTRGIIIRANSPGGSPVLSGMAYDEIRRLKKQYPAIPVVTVVEEVCASGCYYIAAATDRIYADKASIIGSIGVLSEGFGFTGTMEKLGVERRLMTSGNNKGMGDPFSPVKPEQEAIRQQLLDTVHQQFIQAVRDGRGKRLQQANAEIFSGRVWLGSQSQPLGLIDGLSSVRQVAREQFKAEKLVEFTPDEGFGKRAARLLGVQFAQGMGSLFDTRYY
ncbi:S49 family peptidase [Craterilacuibacter sinensis]|uniref:S49 family peptidase n=1 Tax=Craterilacuibacter sinensis TaxID=2686017 RepID=A0A845BJ85_9NEIS|nr:S49 family peptidase [Craterilacuibacter sinensis]MXR36355.1 S49 family peptidase [Craterilacuibacter sinensis]RQW27868.1 S49 family peptidase [Rhodobacteraceae bacterium CH30]